LLELAAALVAHSDLEPPRGRVDHVEAGAVLQLCGVAGIKTPRTHDATGIGRDRLDPPLRVRGLREAERAAVPADAVAVVKQDASMCEFLEHQRHAGCVDGRVVPVLEREGVAVILRGNVVRAWSDGDVGRAMGVSVENGLRQSPWIFGITHERGRGPGAQEREQRKQDERGDGIHLLFVQLAARHGEKRAPKEGKLQKASVSKEQLIAELEKLSPEERWEIFDAFRFQQPDPGEPTEDEKALLDRELEEYRKNPSDVVPWEEVKAQLRRDREQAG
jgi:putative addiction module component (TIGR02574 family)